ncbi:unnamed protein product [Rotaria magnacalcarata]|nr:unnamed protein product [Rotaria magnacalcarata]
MLCLTEERCRTINFRQSIEQCELFIDIPDSGGHVSTSIATVFMTVINGARMPPGVYYNAIGSFPNRTAAFAFYASHFGQLSRYHQFQILFRKNLPGIVKFIYYQASDGGASATIGVQNSSSGLSMTYAFTQVNAMTNTMALIFGTNMDTFSG